MKTNEKKALRDKTEAELEALLREKRHELLRTQMETSLGKIKNVHAARKLRGELAVIETIKREKEMMQHA